MWGIGSAHQRRVKAHALRMAVCSCAMAALVAGALVPDAAADSPAARHWAYQPPGRSCLPQVAHADWCRSSIDRFVLARLEQAGWTPARPAERARWIRRVYLDLIGLPPSLDAVDGFLADARPDARHRIVDRLLASPRFGERWAQHWLDLARYADSNGFQADQLRTVWPYRDWVIDALNADMPFDDFSIQQIAGDLVADADVDSRIATGFHRATTCNVEAGVDPEENRVNQVVDRVNTTGSVWLGTTLACAQCHDHKYDPITMTDYYRLFAYFNNTPMEVRDRSDKGVTYDFYGPTLELPSSPESESRLATLQDEMALLQRLRENRQDESSKQEQGNIDNRFKEIKRQMRELAQPTTLVMVEMPEGRTTHVMQRGSYLDPGAAVDPGVPAVLHAPRGDLPRNRLGLARWLLDPGHPLVSRVVVNRWWAELFGQGIVDSLEDFGSRASRPSHRRLLDWLAVEFVEGGWSMKRLLRKVVLSATYAQTSHVAMERRVADPHNRLLARGPRVRLPAETIRDSALAVSGLLSYRMGGPPVMPHQPALVWRAVGRNAPEWIEARDENRFRRGVYVVWRRAAPYPSFVNFDAPERTSCVVQRPRTNTPLQALTLMNDPAYVEMAMALAARILSDRPHATEADRVMYAFRLCVARKPRTAEARFLQEALAKGIERLRREPQSVAELQRASSVWTLPEGLDPTEWAAWFHVATILLNLDETITKG